MSCPVEEFESALLTQRVASRGMAARMSGQLYKTMARAATSAADKELPLPFGKGGNEYPAGDFEDLVVTALSKASGLTDVVDDLLTRT